MVSENSMNGLDQAALQRIVSTLEPPSDVIIKMMALLQSPDTVQYEIENCVNEDPLLALEVIRIANAADGGGRLRVDSISEAISFLGCERLFRAAMSYAFSKLSSRDLVSYGLSSEAFYRKSQICGVTMDYLSDKESSSYGGHYYTVGLLHAIGELVIDRYLVENRITYDIFSGTRLRPLSLLETELLGINQAQIAGEILRSWGFEDSIVRPIEGQFDLQIEQEFKESATALSTARYVTELIIKDGVGGVDSTTRTSHMIYKGKSLCKVVAFVKGELGLDQVFAS